MTIIDAGPLVAIFDRSDACHASCVAAMDRLSRPLVTTWPVITEAMHILRSRAGWYAQKMLWDILVEGDIRVQAADEDLARIFEIMSRYHDIPMDLADATLVALAERLRKYTVFTVDGDFHTYRAAGNRPFKVVP